MADMGLDGADFPLMRDTQHRDSEDGSKFIPDVDELLEKNLRHPGLFIWLLTFSAGISGLLFGCMYFGDRNLI